MKVRKALIEYNPISSRIITARFNVAAFKITVIHAYAPTSVCSGDEVEVFYNTLEDVLAKTSRIDIRTHHSRRLKRESGQR